MLTSTDLTAAKHNINATQLFQTSMLLIYEETPVAWKSLRPQLIDARHQMKPYHKPKIGKGFVGAKLAASNGLKTLRETITQIGKLAAHGFPHASSNVEIISH